MAVNSIHRAYLTIRYIADYPSGTQLDITQPFPSYIKDLVVETIRFLPPGMIKNKFKTSREAVIKRIEEHIAIDKHAGTASFLTSPPDDVLQFIDFALHNMVISTLAYDVDLFKELVGVLKVNKIQFDLQKFSAQKDKITIALLYLLHNTTLKLRKDVIAICKITDSEKADDKFLALQAQFPMHARGKNLTMSVNIIGTSLHAKDWCDEQIMTNLRITLPDNVVLSDEFRFETP